MTNVIQLPTPYKLPDPAAPYVLPDRAAEARDGLATELRLAREEYLRRELVRKLRAGIPLGMAELVQLDAEPDLLAEARGVAPREPEEQPDHLGGFR